MNVKRGMNNLEDDFLNIIKGYQDIKVKIDQHTVFKESAERDKKYYLKQLTASEPHDINAINYDNETHGNFSPISADRAVDGIHKCESMIYLEQCELDRLNKEKKKIEDSINQLKDLDQKVAYKRILEGETFKQIADELGYTEQYMRLIYSKVAKTIQQTFNIQELKSDL